MIASLMQLLPKVNELFKTLPDETKEPNMNDKNMRSTLIVFLITFIIYLIYTISSSLIPAIGISIVIALLYYLNMNNKKLNLNVEGIFEHIKNFLNMIFGQFYKSNDNNNNEGVTNKLENLVKSMGI